MSFFIALILMGHLAACQSLYQDKALQDSEASLIETQLSLVQTQVDQGQAAVALQGLKNLLRQFPEHTQVLSMLGIVQLNLKNEAAALPPLRKAYELEPSALHALNLSSALLATGKPAEARALLKPHLKDAEYPYPERLWHNVGLSYENEGDSSRALLNYQKALGENPSYYLSLLRSASLQVRAQQPRKAEQSYKSALEACAICFEAVEGLTRLYTSTNRREEAKELLQSFMKEKEAHPKDKKSAKRLLALNEKACIKDGACFAKEKTKDMVMELKNTFQ